jgi:hypothetical protein
MSSNTPKSEARREAEYIVNAVAIQLPLADRNAVINALTRDLQTAADKLKARSN